jgi:hypothetical protein
VTLAAYVVDADSHLRRIPTRTVDAAATLHRQHVTTNPNEIGGAMAATTQVDVVGSSPITFTNTEGAQKFVPLSALQFTGSQIGLRSPSPWTSLFDQNEATRLLAVAQAKAAIGELTPQQAASPAPALAFTAAHTGPETNGITVTASTPSTPGTGGPLNIPITITAIETDTWPGLKDGTSAAKQIGVDNPTGKADDPAAGTGLIVVVQGSVATATANVGIPVDVTSTTLKASTPVDILDQNNNTVFSITPRADYTGKGGLSFSLTNDSSGTTFTISATYDSTKEQGTPSPITLQSLSSLAKPVAYLITATAPPSGALVPADASVQLSGGGPGIAANGLIYT